MQQNASLNGLNARTAEWPACMHRRDIGAVEGIHCLHYIWQYHYIDVSPEVQAKGKEIPEMYERHFEHCVDYIRQYLMWKFDTTSMPFNWVLDHQDPTPNGNTIHKCVNWHYLQG